MKATLSVYPKTILTLIFSLAIFTAACDNPAGSDEDHGGEHTEPHAMELIMNGETVVEYVDGEVSGKFNVSEGQESARITVEFINEEGKPIHDEDLGDEYSLGWNIEDDQVVGIEQHDADGKWSFHLVGKSAGTSGVQFQLLHSGHSDFETPAATADGAIVVNVASSSN